MLVVLALLEESGANVDLVGAFGSFEPITLNHRVPGSSPGALTKLFKDIALIGIRTVSSV